MKSVSTETAAKKVSEETEAAVKISEEKSGNIGSVATESKVSAESVAMQQEQTSPVVSEEKTKAQNASDVERKPIAQTSPATTALKVPNTPKATTKTTTVKAEDTKAEDEDGKIDNQLKPDIDEDVNLDSGDKLPFDESEATEMPEKDLDTKTDLEYPNNAIDDDDDEYGGDMMARDNNRAPEVNPKLPMAPVAENDAESQRLQGDPQTKIEHVAFEEDPDSNFFAYLCSVMFLCVFLYILHQNRQKLLALCLEGRRGNRRSSRSRGGSKAAYSKLDCNLEEAITSTKSMSGKSMDIIY